MVCVGPVYASGQRCTKSPNRAGLIDRRPLCVRYLKSSWATTGSVSPFFGCSSFSSFRTSCESVLSWHVVGCVSFVVSGVGVSIPTSTSWDGLMSGSWCMSCRLLVLRKNRVQPSIPIFGTYSISSSHSDLVGRSFPSPKCRLRVSVKYISDRFLYFISISYHWEMRFLFLSAGAMVLRHLTISEGNLLDNWSSTWFALRFVHFLVLSYGVSILPWMGLPLLNLRWANEQCSA